MLMDSDTPDFSNISRKNPRDSGCSGGNHAIELPRPFNLFRKVSVTALVMIEDYFSGFPMEFFPEVSRKTFFKNTLYRSSSLSRYLYV